MKKYLIIVALLLQGCSTTPENTSECNPYAKIGAGLKVEETPIAFYDGSKSSPISARLQAGYECKNVSVGIDHLSQYLKGWPVNNDSEYSRTEIFVDYKVYF